MPSAETECNNEVAADTAKIETASAAGIHQFLFRKVTRSMPWR
jgi:hypothetical protein